jgi:hypothetical protein
MKKILKFCAPHGLVEMRRAAEMARQDEVWKERRVGFHLNRRQVIAQAVGAEDAPPAPSPGFKFEAGIQFLVDAGLEESQIRQGSIPARSLEFAIGKIAEQAWRRPIYGLHVGNFLGLSLAAFVSALTDLHPESLVMAVDPNVPHREIISPQNHVLALLSHFGLQRNTLVIVGYSGRKAVSNDGVIYGAYDPSQNFSRENACENVLANITVLVGTRIDVAILDGNHDAVYLRRELDELAGALRPGGLVVLDDVDTAWDELRQVYRSLPSRKWDDLGTDGRVGVLRFSPQ